jgi:mannose-1-phosphate guanylyltransferase
MFAVVLVGGFGTRLRPLTNDIPKPLLPLGQRTILECLMSQLARGGVTDAVLALGFKPEPFLAAFPDARCAGVRLQYAIESSPLDTAGAIGFAARSVGLHERNEAFVVANGDIVTDLAIASLIAQHHANVGHGALATIHLTPVEDPSQFGVVQFDTSGKVSGFVEKPAPGTVTSRHVNAGTYVFESAVLRQLPGDAPLSVERVTFPALASSGELFAYPTDDYWLDAGRPDTYVRGNLDLINGVRREHDVAIHADARIHTTAVVTNSVVGAGASIAAGAHVVDSVIFPNASIGERANVRSSAVLGNVSADAQVREALVGAEQN